MNIDPRGMTPIEWTDAVNLISSGQTPTQRLDDNNLWQEWATNLSNAATIEGQNIPDPWTTNNFEEWAMQFNLTVNLETL